MIHPTTRGSSQLPAWSLAIVAATGIWCTSMVDAAGKAKVLSEWLAQPITVDGVNKEWPSLTSFGKDARFSIAVRNDERNLYLALMTSDSTRGLQALNDGLIVWFDVEGGTKKRVGLNYPLGRDGGPPRGNAPNGQSMGAGRRDQPGEPPSEMGEGGPAGSPGQPPDAETMWERALADPRLRQAEWLGPGKNDRHVLMLNVRQAIQAKIGRADGVMIYELAIPLAKTEDTPDGLGVKPGAIIGIGLETPERNTSMAPPGGGRGGGGMGGPGGGMGGPGGGMGGPGGGMGGPGGGTFGAQTKALKAWTTVQLATAPAVK